uniref:Uncharacterized protein n=1 Tax=Octopus bimaculoides TaxID=37653 RepID=A0A0L8FPY4_OCTBM
MELWPKQKQCYLLTHCLLTNTFEIFVALMRRYSRRGIYNRLGLFNLGNFLSKFNVIEFKIFRGNSVLLTRNNN